MADRIVTVIVALLASGLIQTLLARRDKKDEDRKALVDAIKDLKEYVENKFAEIEKKQIVAEKDALRTQLLTLIISMPDEQQEILTLGRHYFVDLQGNWYMTTIFKRWCAERNIEPDWFEG